MDLSRGRTGYAFIHYFWALAAQSPGVPALSFYQTLTNPLWLGLLAFDKTPEMTAFVADPW